MPLFVTHSLRTGLIAAGLALGVACTIPASAQTGAPAPVAGDTVIAKGNGFTVTENDLKAALANPALGTQGLQLDQHRDALVNYMIDYKILLRAAEDAKTDQDPDFIKKLAEFKQQFMIESFLEKEVTKSVTPAAIKELYDEAVKNMKPEPEIRARHILVDSEEEAKAVIERLKKGEDFAKVAAEVSKDTGSKNSGGELGFFTKDRMIAPFADAAFKLEPKQVSAPVKTEFGWHVIEVEEKRDRPVPSLEEMTPQLEERLTREVQQHVISALREKADVQRLDQPAAKEPAKEPAKK